MKNRKKALIINESIRRQIISNYEQNNAINILKKTNQIVVDNKDNLIQSQTLNTNKIDILPNKIIIYPQPTLFQKIFHCFIIRKRTPK